MLSGLNPGDSVITSGQLKIFGDNFPVMPVPPQTMPIKSVNPIAPAAHTVSVVKK